MTSPSVRRALAAALVCTACGDGAGSPVGPDQPADDPVAPPANLAGMLVFIVPGGYLTAMDLVSGATARLGPIGYFHHVSPDGRRLVYNTRDQTPAIVIHDMDRRTGTLIDMPGRNVAPRWSPDGARILFWSSRTGVSQLWIMDADGGNERQLTHTPDGENLEGDWSPDGTTIAFRRCVGTGPGACSIWLIDATGSNLRQLTHAERHDQAPRWSPDGRRIALVRLTGFGAASNWDVWVMDADGRNMVRVTDHPHDEWAATWTPDGSRLAFFRFDHVADRSSILTVRPDGSELTLLVNGPEQPVYGPPR
jgi:Tol biopolymer transport system component